MAPIFFSFFESPTGSSTAQGPAKFFVHNVVLIFLVLAHGMAALLGNPPPPPLASAHPHSPHRRSATAAGGGRQEGAERGRGGGGAGRDDHRHEAQRAGPQGHGVRGPAVRWGQGEQLAGQGVGLSVCVFRPRILRCVWCVTVVRMVEHSAAHRMSRLCGRTATTSRWGCMSFSAATRTCSA